MQGGFDRNRAHVPFPALPHGSRRPKELCELFEVESIPTLVLLRKDGTLISKDGVRLLRKHTRAFPWASNPPPEVPHHHPLFERVLRRDGVDTGHEYDLPRYRPIDFLALPATVDSLAAATSALRECDHLCTQLMCQAHCVLNTRLFIVALVQQTFTVLLPLPMPDTDPMASSGVDVWRSTMTYPDQHSILLLIQRLMEHFAASVFSLDHTRSLDAVRMVVPACMAAIADCVLRQVASDKPSCLSAHLEKYTIGCAGLDKQSATVPVSTPELNTARTCVLDYFEAQARRCKSARPAMRARPPQTGRPHRPDAHTELHESPC